MKNSKASHLETRRS